MKPNWNFAAASVLAELMLKDEYLALQPIAFCRHKSIGGMGESREYLFAASFEDNSKVGLDLFFMLSDYSHYMGNEFDGNCPAEARSWGIRHMILNEQREGEYVDPHRTDRLTMEDGCLFWDGNKIIKLTQVS
jgi:hypothetical protein